MGNVTEEKWIEMLEKKADGNYIAKYPKVKSKSGVTFDEHLEDNANPHEVNKGQVGLSNVENYAIATQAQAEAGTVNNAYMTPLRTKEAINKNITTIVQTFTSSGTWTKPANANWVFVDVFGGGGGGSGGAYASSGTGGRGQGGGGGARMQALIPADALPSSVQVIVGSGGSGGAGTTSTPLTAGTDGGYSRFANIIANGGKAGTDSGPGSGGDSYVSMMWDGANGTGGSDASTPQNSYMGAGGGSSGNYSSSGSDTAEDGGDAGLPELMAVAKGGTAPGGNGSDAIRYNGLPVTAGAGGAGGQVGSGGGNGGIPGGGGGGGGGRRTSGTGGRGGNGARGEVTVVWW